MFLPEELLLERLQESNWEHTSVHMDIVTAQWFEHY